MSNVKIIQYHPSFSQCHPSSGEVADDGQCVYSWIIGGRLRRFPLDWLTYLLVGFLVALLTLIIALYVYRNVAAEGWYFQLSAAGLAIWIAVYVVCVRVSKFTVTISNGDACIQLYRGIFMRRSRRYSFNMPLAEITVDQTSQKLGCAQIRDNVYLSLGSYETLQDLPGVVFR
jgi:hypothetical protein